LFSRIFTQIYTDQIQIYADLRMVFRFFIKQVGLSAVILMEFRVKNKKSECF